MPGRPFLQVPGPTNVPERILRAMAQPVLDHRGAEFAALTRELLDGLEGGFHTTPGPVVVVPSPGAGGRPPPRRRFKSGSPPTAPTRSRRSWWCTTRPPPG